MAYFDKAEGVSALFEFSKIKCFYTIHYVKIVFSRTSFAHPLLPENSSGIFQCNQEILLDMALEFSSYITEDKTTCCITIFFFSELYP